MEDILIVFASYTSAVRVKKLLKKKYDIDTLLQQTPADLSADGCSHCLKANVKHTEIIWNIVKQNKLSSKGIYKCSDFSKIR